MTTLTVTERDGVATFSMSDPLRRNALGADMLNALTTAFDNLGEGTRAVVLRAAAGCSVWCAGFDIRSLRPGFDPLSRDGALQRLFERIAGCRAVVIGMVHGSAWGGGTDIALRCDILVGDPTCSFAFTPARLGLPYDADGLLNAAQRIGPALVLEMFATAQPMNAERAASSGLLNHLVSEAELEEFVFEMAAVIARNAPLTVASAKRHLRAITSALPIPVALAQMLNEGRAAALASADYAEGIEAFKAKRRPNFTGS